MDSISSSAASGREIERKFLIATADVPDRLDRYPHDAIQQGYLVIGATGEEVRVRRKGSHWFLTVKSGGDLQRSECEIELTPQQFQQLWPATAGRRVEKTRYRIRCGCELIELDIYEGALAGLCVAEVEFASVEASAAFAPPAWLGREVTRDARYKNRCLALHGMPAIDG